MQGRARQFNRLKWHEDPSAIEEQWVVYDGCSPVKSRHYAVTCGSAAVWLFAVVT